MQADIFTIWCTNMKKFTDFHLSPEIQDGVDAAGFTDCTPVQAETFEALFKGHDATVKSQTGTGKTAAFLISLFQIILEKRKSQAADQQREQVLILAPTRELVVQIEEEAQVLGKFLDFSFCSVYGGVGYHQQERQLANRPDFIIGTPGRLLDFVQNHKINLGSFSYLVIDEADRMFDMGFYPDIQKILRGMKARNERRTLLFSATLSTKVLNIAWNFMNDPVDIEIEPEQITLDAITQKIYHLSRNEKIPLLLGLIKKYKPESALFFTNTKRMAEELSFRLRSNQFTAEFIMGDLPQKKRLRIIKAVKKKEINFLVATDVAARGLHIDDLGMVFNYDLPEDAENYVHRIGRTARAGNAGIAISFVDEQSVYNLSAIEKFIGMKIPAETITDELLEEDRSRHTRFHSEYSKGRSPRGSNTSSPSHNTRGRGRQGRPSTKPTDARPSHNSRNRSRSAQASNLQRQNNPQRAQKSVKQPQNRPSPPVDQVLSGTMTEKQRLSYYAQKYGENFALQKSSGTQSNTRPSNRRGNKLSNSKPSNRQGNKLSNSKPSNSKKSSSKKKQDRMDQKTQPTQAKTTKRQSAGAKTRGKGLRSFFKNTFSKR